MQVNTDRRYLVQVYTKKYKFVQSVDTYTNYTRQSTSLYSPYILDPSIHGTVEICTLFYTFGELAGGKTGALCWVVKSPLLLLSLSNICCKVLLVSESSFPHWAVSSFFRNSLFSSNFSARFSAARLVTLSCSICSWAIVSRSLRRTLLLVVQLFFERLEVSILLTYQGKL